MAVSSITGIGQDSHAFCAAGDKPLVLAGVHIPNALGLEGNSDADVILHALCNAISSISGEVILGAVTDTLCQQGIIDSREYVRYALTTLDRHTLRHVAVSIECLRPKLADYILPMRESIADLCCLSIAQVGITATSGEGLTAFGQAKGIQALVIASAERPIAAQ